MVTFSTSYFILSIISYTLFFSLSFLLHLNFFFMVDAYKILQQNRKNQLWFHYINSHFNFSMFIFFSSFVAMAYILSQILIWSFMTFLTLNSKNLSLKVINSLHFSLPSNFTPYVFQILIFLLIKIFFFCLVFRESFGLDNCWSQGSLKQTSFPENGWPSFPENGWPHPL